MNIVASIVAEEDVPLWDSYDLGSNLTLGNHTDFDQLKCHLDHLDALVIHLSFGSLPDGPINVHASIEFADELFGMRSNS